jgi:hypothetical protein
MPNPGLCRIDNVPARSYRLGTAGCGIVLAMPVRRVGGETRSDRAVAFGIATQVVSRNSRHPAVLAQG